MSDIFGKKLGQYMLLEQLGEGGMAKVYNALDERIEKNVAIKVILPNKRSSQVFLQQFELEAKSLANLTHTNIVKVLNYGTEDGQPYLVMEFVPRGTLKDAMAGGLPWQKAAEILAPIARALDYVHNHKIVHQDIKPSNILLDEEFRPMLSDFGVVKLLEAKDGENNAAIGVGVGTPDYMSPEQGMGKDVDFRADIYSLGVVFYELVIGEKPFIADTPMAVVIKHATDEFPSPRKVNREIPKFVESAILRAVQKNPEDRYVNMGQFADVLEFIAMGEKAPRKKILSLTRKNKHRKNTVLWAGLPAVLLVIIGIFLVGLNFNEFNKLIGSIIGRPQVVTAVDLATPVTKTVIPSATILVKSTPDSTATPSSLSTSPILSATSTQIPAQNQEASVSLLGTPFSILNKPGFTEIARWGIGGVNNVRWSPNGDTIALGTTSGIFLYDSQSKALKRFINPNFNVIALAFSPDGSQILAGSLDGRVKAWHIKTGEFYRSYGANSSRVNALSFSKNQKNVIVGYDDGSFIVHPVDQNNVTLSSHLYPSVESVVSSADERFLYVSNGTENIYIWDINTKKQTEDKLEHLTPVNKLVISADRQFLLSAGENHIAYLWDLVDMRLVNSFSNLGGRVIDMDFSPDGSLIVIGLDNGQIKVFAKPEIKDYSKAQVPILAFDTFSNQLQSISFSPSQMVVASGNWADGLNIWNVKTGEKINSLDQSMSGIMKLEFSDDATWLATSHEGNIVRVWDVATAKQAYQFDGYLSKGVSFSPNSQFLAIIKTKKSNQDLAIIQIVELSSGNIVSEMLGYAYATNSFLQFSDDNKLLVTGTLDKATIWDVSSWEKVNTRGGRVNDGCGHFLTPENKILSVISNVGIFFDYLPTDEKMCGTSPEGTTFMYYFQKQAKMVFVKGDGQVWTWDFKSTDISTLDPRHIYPNPSDIFLSGNQESGLYASVSGSSLYIKNISGTLYGTISGQDDYGYKVAFLPTQKLFALGSRYGSIHIWKLP